MATETELDVFFDLAEVGAKSGWRLCEKHDKVEVKTTVAAEVAGTAKASGESLWIW